MPHLRSLVASILLVIVVAAAGAAHAEEAIVLDNGAVLRGAAIREDSVVVVFRLAGLGTDNRIEIRRDRIVKRFSTDLAGELPGSLDPDPTLGATSPNVVVGGKGTRRPAPSAASRTGGRAGVPLPQEEPQAHEEGFVERLARLAVVAFPRDPGSRTFLAGLAFVVLLCLVGLGGRMADVKGLTLAKTTILAFALGAVVAMDVLWYESILRADRATWVLPAEVAAWVGTAALTMRCGVGRSVLLLAFVVFAGAVVTFASGAVLVAA